MPLTGFQRALLAILAKTRSADSHLAGGAAIHFSPNSVRYSEDLDFFHDSASRVATAFAEDEARLRDTGHAVEIEISQPGFIRAIVARGEEKTRIDWAHESAWRFVPPVRDPLGGFLLHEIDLAINKTLALAGRDEPRDFVDILFVHGTVLPLAGLVWAAAGKDRGFTPLSLLELLKRRGRPRPEEVARLRLATPFDPVASKAIWVAALEEADAFVRSRPTGETGCLYYSEAEGAFTIPRADLSLEAQGLAVHFGAPGGIVPKAVES
ncbi:nucleotidyl transferase AbiEii/AbiGii toxin family protein [Candidatus Palauibacter sp.]|uniref:nucleotidyl transferase AbiEii/AbiGii toxin family protein n=1 Tax=Candidatus Palauibacter sp. TaxID=3101350 RepID=UPI003B58EF6B